ncbi:MAG: DMP19 family protein [Oscillospiraceae bacterium]|nr:DMP19 family protein [Oscillospiraceae bacterium]
MSKFDFLTSGDFQGAEAFMENRKRYAVLKSGDLDGIPADEIVFAVTSWIESKFSEDWRNMGEVINSLPTPCINIYCASYIKNEVQSGGFAQAFFNSSRDFIGIAANGFRALGYPKPADIIEQALKINFDSGKKASGHSIEDFLDFANNDEYRTLDKDFCRVFDEKKFGRLARDYIIKYKKYFGENNENLT